MLDLELINKAAHRIYPTHLNEEAPASSFSWNAILPSAAKSTLKNSEGHKETSGRNSHTLTHKLKGGASIEFNVTGNGKNNIVMAKYQKGGKLFTAIHSHEDPHEAMSTVYHSIKKRMVTEEIESTLVEKMAKRIEKKTGKLSDKKEKIDVEPSEEKELKESAKKNQIRKFTFGKDNIHLYHSGTGETYSITPKKIVKIHTGQDAPSGYRYSVIKSGREIKRIHKLLKNAQEGNKELKESTPPGMESWVKKNKAHFVKEYGDKKGHEVLYATAWKLHNKMNEMEELNESKFISNDGREFTTEKGRTEFYPEVHHVFHNGEHVGYVRQNEIQPYKKIAGSRLVKPLAKRKVWNFHLDQGHSLDGKSVKYRDSSGFGSKKAALESLAKHHKSSKLSEEELNELSKKTLASYIKQASHHARSNEYYAGLNGIKSELFGLQKKHLEVANKRQKGIEKAADKLAEAHAYTKEGLAKQIKYHEDRAAHHDSEAQASFNKAQDLTGDKADLHFNAAKGHKAIADLHRKHIYDLKSSAGLTEAEGKVEMMYLSKGFISPKLAEKLARESKHLGTDKSTGEQHYLHPQHGRMALVPHKPSGQFQFRLAEEIEQLDELSSHTLGSYIKHAAIQKGSSAASQAINRRAQYDAETRGDKKGAEQYKQAADKDSKKQDKRFTGIMRATDKLVRKTIKEDKVGLKEGFDIEPPEHVKAIGKEVHKTLHELGVHGKRVSYDYDSYKGPKHHRITVELGHYHPQEEKILDALQSRHAPYKFHYGPNDVEIGTAAVIHPAPSNKMVLKEHINESLIDEPHHANSAKIVQNHPELNRIFNKQEALGNKLTVFRSDNGLHLYSYEAPNIKNRSKIYHSFTHDDNTGESSEVARESGHEHSIHAAWKRYKKHLNEDLDHDHPDMKAYHAACKARDEAHLASIRYRMNHDIKQPAHRAKYDELEKEHHRLKDIEDEKAEKVHGRLFAHHVGFKE